VSAVASHPSICVITCLVPRAVVRHRRALTEKSRQLSYLRRPGTEDLGNHPEVAVGCEVGDPVAAEGTAQDKFVPLLPAAAMAWSKLDGARAM
jgi:hypothetical protein